MPDSIHCRYNRFRRRNALLVATSALLLLNACAPREAPPVTHCDLTDGACPVRLSGAISGELEFSPRPVSTMTAFNVVLRFPVHTQASDRVPRGPLSLDFSGVDMTMGYNRIKLIRDEHGSFRAQALLPICLTGDMRWVATLYEIDTPVARFEFKTGNPR